MVSLRFRIWLLIMYVLEPSHKLNDYIREVEICHDVHDWHMSNSEGIYNSNVESNKVSSNRDHEFETPQRKFKNLRDKSHHENIDKDEKYDHKMASDSKTEPIAIKNDSIMIEDEIENGKQWQTSKKAKKSIKLTHLNRLSAKIGYVGDRFDKSELYPEVIFHTPFWPYPANLTHKQILEQHVLPMFGKSSELDKNCSHDSDHSSWNNPNWRHEKALWKVFDSEGHPVPFDHKWSTHPWHLVIPETPETPDSKMDNDSAENLYSNTHQKMYK